MPDDQLTEQVKQAIMACSFGENEAEAMHYARAAVSVFDSIGPDAGIEAAVKVEEDVGPLVEFFRDEGYHAYGHRGDYEHWSPEETAVHFLREHLACKPPVSVDEAMVEKVAEAIEELIPYSPGTESRRGFPDPRDIARAALSVLSMNTGSEALARAQVSADHPLAKALEQSAETIERIDAIEQASARGRADHRNTLVGSTFHAGYEQAIEEAAPA